MDALLAEPGMTEADAIRRAAALGIDKPVYTIFQLGKGLSARRSRFFIPHISKSDHNGG